MTSLRPVFREHPIPTADSKPYIVANGPDGAIWFCESGPGQIGRLDPDSGVITEFALPNLACAPIGIGAGADGALWFTESKGHRVGRLATAGAIAEFDLPTPEAGPNGIVLGPDSIREPWNTEPNPKNGAKEKPRPIHSMPSMLLQFAQIVPACAVPARSSVW